MEIQNLGNRQHHRKIDFTAVKRRPERLNDCKTSPSGGGTEPSVKFIILRFLVHLLSFLQQFLPTELCTLLLNIIWLPSQ